MGRLTDKNLNNLIYCENITNELERMRLMDGEDIDYTIITNLEPEDIVEIFFKDCVKNANIMSRLLDEYDVRKFLFKFDASDAESFITYTEVLCLSYGCEIAMRLLNLDEVFPDKFNSIIKNLLLRISCVYADNNYPFVEKDYLRIQGKLSSIINQNNNFQKIPLYIVFQIANDIFNPLKVSKVFNKSKYNGYIDDLTDIIRNHINKYLAK